jgi:hypothetical protein
MTQTQNASIFITDEVYCTVSGIAPVHVKHFYEKFGLFVEGHRYIPAVKLGRWDGKKRFFQPTGKTYVRLLEDIVPDLIGFGYDPNIVDKRDHTPFPVKRASTDQFGHIMGYRGKPLEVRQYQVDAVNQLVECGDGFLIAATGCVDEDTEFMTRTGWKRIADYQDGVDEVLQYDKETGVASFVAPTAYIKAPSNGFYHFKTKYGVDMMLSPEHRILHYGGATGDTLMETTAELLAIRHNETKLGAKAGIPTTFNFDGFGDGLALSESQIRVMVAVNADATVQPRVKGDAMVINIKKARKKERLEMLLKMADIEYNVCHRKSGFSAYTFTAPVHAKRFSDWATCANREQLAIIADEVHHWDGGFGTNRIYFSNIKEDADFVQFAVSSGGALRATITVDDRPGKNITYGVSVTDRTTPTLVNSTGRAEISLQECGEFKYCFEVPSSYLVLRRNGNIFVTGNSGKTLITASLADIYTSSGYPVVVIVPSGDLVKQTYEAFKMCGLDAGRYDGDVKDVDHAAVVATWQSLQNNPHMMKLFKCVIVDEAHGAKAEVIQTLINDHGMHIPFRFGVTGTFPKPDTDQMALIAAIGPIRHKITARWLIDNGYLATIDIEMMETLDSPEDGELPDYASEKSWLAKNEDRTTLLAELLEDCKNKYGNTLVLTADVKFGKRLAQKCDTMYMHGETEGEDRAGEYALFESESDKLLICSMGIAKQGVSIDRVFCLVIIDSGKSFVTAIQSVGRGLRLADDKKSVKVIDISSSLKFSKKHRKERVAFYTDAEYPHGKIQKLKY